MKRSLLALGVLGAFGGAAHAQSTVTLYGTIDEGLNFTSNAAGHRGYSTVSGDTSASVWGVKGTEDLGSGTNAIFQLENSFDANNGGLLNGGREFGRQAFVGLASARYGTLTLGRQYDAAVDMWSVYTGAGNQIGDLAAHPFDNDNADYDYRFNNSVKYLSPSYAGFQAEAVYGFSNSTGFSANRAYSAAGNYTMGPFSAVVAYSRHNNGGTTTGGAIGNDAVFVGSSQQNIDAGLKWTFSNASNMSFAYSHTDVYSPTSNLYVSNIGTQSWASWKFDNFELNGQYFYRPDLWFAGSYTFTHSNLRSSSGGSTPNWHQLALMLDYDLSKRTSVYLQGAYQHTNARTGTAFDNANIIGSSAASSSGHQMLYRVALMHKF